MKMRLPFQFSKEHFEEHKLAYIAGLTVLGLLTLYLLIHFQGGPSGGPDAPQTPDAADSGSGRVPSTLFRVHKTAFNDNLQINGAIKGGAEVELRFRAEGKLAAFHFKVGDKIAKDEVIAQLDAKDSDIKLKQAEIELDQHEKLYQAGAIIASKLEQARLAAELARSEYERTFLRAPQEGYLGERNAEVGESISPQMRVATLVNTQTVIAEMGIIEKDVEKINIGQTVSMTVDSYPGTTFDGKITNKGEVFGGKSRTLTAQAVFENPESQLKPGMYARCQVAVYSSSQTMVIPSGALDLSNPAAPKVFVLGEEKTAQARAVKTGYISHDFAEVLQGLKEKELIVAELGEAVKEGTIIETIGVQEYDPVSGKIVDTDSQKEPGLPGAQQEEPF